MFLTNLLNPDNFVFSGRQVCQIEIKALIIVSGIISRVAVCLPFWSMGQANKLPFLSLPFDDR